MGQFGPLPRVGWYGKLVLTLSEAKGHAQFVEPLQPLKYLKKVVQHVILDLNEHILETGSDVEFVAKFHCEYPIRTM